MDYFVQFKENDFILSDAFTKAIDKVELEIQC